MVIHFSSPSWCATSRSAPSCPPLGSAGGQSRRSAVGPDPASAGRARRFLEAVAVSGQPVRQASACRVAGLGADGLASLAVLRAGHLVRSAGPGSLDDVEVYHDRIRETVIKHLSPEVLKTWHGELARVLEDAGGADSETLAVHFEAAGEARDGREVLRRGCRKGRQGPGLRPRGQALPTGPRALADPWRGGAISACRARRRAGQRRPRGRSRPRLSRRGHKGRRGRGHPVAESRRLSVLDQRPHRRRTRDLQSTVGPSRHAVIQHAAACIAKVGVVPDGAAIQRPRVSEARRRRSSVRRNCFGSTSRARSRWESASWT